MTWRAKPPRPLPLLSLFLLALTGCDACQRSPGKKSARARSVQTPATTPVDVTGLDEGERPARLAGSWYAADPDELRSQLTSFVEAAAKQDKRQPPAGRLLGLIVPHAGHQYSGRTAASAYRLLTRAKPRRLFLLGPTHHKRLRAVAVVEGKRFATPLGALPIDGAARQRLLRHTLFIRDAEADAKEHSIEVQMPFVRHLAARAEVVPLIVGQLTLDEVHKVAAAIRAELRPGDLIVASSDFTHYGPRFGYVPFRDDVPQKLRELDMQAWDRIAAGDIAAFWRFKHETEDTICGFYPISVLMAVAGAKASARLLRYDTSGNITGDFSSSVSYVAGAIAVPTDWKGPEGEQSFLAPAEQQRALQIARRAIAHHFRSGGERFDPAAAGIAIDGRLAERHGVFVTLKNKSDDSLRGCIGTVRGAPPLHQGIVDNALNAALRDPRFEPLRAEDLERVRVEVTVLTPPRPVSGPEAITIGRDGIILSKQGHGALFLPQVAVEQGWGLVRTLSALSRKAGLGLDGWRGARYETFQGHVYDEAHL